MTQLEATGGPLRGEAFLASLQGTSATVIGLARESAAAVRLLEIAGAHVRVEPVFTTADLTGEAVIVIMAAAALDSPAVTAARAAGVIVLGDLDLGWCSTEADTFAIVGGAAARATVGFARAVLARPGRPVLTAGGAELDLVECGPGFIESGLVIVEPSPAQLATAQVFRPRVAAVVAGLGDDLGGRPTSLEWLLARQTARDCVVLDADDAEARALARHARPRVVWCSATGPVDHGVYVLRGRITARLNDQVEEICPIEGLPRSVLPAALAAVACGLWMGMPAELIAAALLAGRAGATERSETVERAGEARLSVIKRSEAAERAGEARLSVIERSEAPGRAGEARLPVIERSEAPERAGASPGARESKDAREPAS